MKEMTWRQFGNLWLVSVLDRLPELSGHFIVSHAQAEAFARAVLRANEPRDEDVADVMEAG